MTRALELADRIHDGTDWYEFDAQSFCLEVSVLLREQHEALKAALYALEVATTPLAKDRQEVLAAVNQIKELL